MVKLVDQPIKWWPGGLPQIEAEALECWNPPHIAGSYCQKGVFYKKSVFHLGKQRDTLRST